MNRSPCSGMTMVELLVAMAIATLLGSMLLQLVLCYQARILTEISRNDLQDRTERLIRFLADDIGTAAFLVGPAPQVADGTPPVLVHDSLPGDPLETLSSAILAEDRPGEDDRLTIVKAISFAPPLCLTVPGLAGESSLVLNRRPNSAPGSTRELLPVPEAINHLVLAGQPHCYTVQHADTTLDLDQPLAENVPADTELLGVRAFSYLLEDFSGGKRLRRDDFTSRDILDDAVDGLQFQYLLADGSLVDQPLQSREIRGIRIGLLVRDLRSDRQYVDIKVYTLGNRSYGPFRDHFRRCQASRLVEVTNNGL